MAIRAGYIVRLLLIGLAGYLLGTLIGEALHGLTSFIP